MEELDLKELLQIFWEKKMQIILITAIFMVIGVIYTLLLVTPKYVANTKLLLATNASSQTSGSEAITTTDVTLNSKLVSTYSELVQTNKVTREVMANLNSSIDEEKIKKNVTVSAVSDTEFIKIQVKDEDPVMAAKIANETSKVFIETVKEYYGIENVHIVDEAEIPEKPSNINHKKDILIFAVVGLILASMYVLIANMLDTTVKSSEDIEKITGLTVLASIPVYEITEDKRKGGKK